METIKTATSRIHPLMAAAAVSVILVSLAGTAAITGMLPSSHGAPEPASLNTAQNPAYGAANGNNFAAVAPQPNLQGVQPVQSAYGQPVAYGQPLVATQAAVAAPAPVVIKETVIKEVPVKHTVYQPVHHTTRTASTHHTSSYARDDGYYAPAARPVQPAQPNYMAIGTGAVLGGLVGNQIGSGNGRKLATVAGVIGGGLIGNQIANQNR